MPQKPLPLQPGDWEAASEYLALSGPAILNVKDKAFKGGAKGDGVADDSAAIQAAIDACTLVGGTVFLPGVHKASGLTLKSRVRLVGKGAQVIDGTTGAVLVGTAGTDTITLADQVTDVGVSDVLFYGGKSQIVSNSVFTTQVYLNNLNFSSAVEAGIRVRGGAIERWYVTNCNAVGGQYFYKHDNVTVSGVNYIDKTHFLNCRGSGQTVSAYYIEVNNSNDVTWTNPNIVSSGKTGFYGAGGISGWTFINPNTEGIGQLGKSNATTLSGTVTAPATSATLASATGWATGDGMTIQGAGSNGTDFTIVSTANGGPGVTVSGTTVSWTGGTSRTVTGPAVTNAEYDEFSFQFLGANPAGVQFVGGNLGGVGSGAHLRYAANLNGAFWCNFHGTRSFNNVPIYDPNARARVYGYKDLVVRRPNTGPCIYPLYDDMIPTFAGTPTDANISGTAYDGLQVLDTSGIKLWVRVGGLWKGVVVA